MGEIYEVRRWDGLRCHDIHTKFHKDWFSHSKVDMGGSDEPTFFFQNKESELKSLCNNRKACWRCFSTDQSELGLLLYTEDGGDMSPLSDRSLRTVLRYNEITDLRTSLPALQTIRSTCIKLIGLAVMILTRIREVLGLNRLEHKPSWWRFSWSLLAPQGRCRDSTSIRRRCLLSKLTFVCYPAIRRYIV
jgi:hypothetical protein